VDRLSDFVDEHLKKGVSTSEMKTHLVSNGWSEKEVDNAINSAKGKKTKRTMAFAFIGIAIVAILALILISMTKVDNPPTITQTNNGNVHLDPPINAQSCMNKEYSIDKDECYKTLIATGFDCETIDDNIEFTYCTRAYENIMIKGTDESS
jgi:hypothetical protein